MEDNKIEKTKKEIEQVANAVKKAKSGNVLGAAKELLKNRKMEKETKEKINIICIKYFYAYYYTFVY